MGVVFMFSGQGSHYYNMGAEMYNNNPTFRKWMDVMDEIVCSITGKSVVNVLYDTKHKKDETFDDISYTSAAIFMVEYSLAQVLFEKGIYPDCVLGTGVGEYSSATVSNVISYESGIRCLLKQAKMIRNNCEKGAMLSILENRNLYNKSSILSKNSEFAAVSYDSHFVVAGSIEGIEEIERYLKSNEIICQRLPVNYAFHSSLIDPISSMYNDFLKTITYKTPQINFYSCVLGNRLKSLESDYFWDVIRKPVKFQNAINTVFNQDGEYIFVDVGPSGTLANFSKRNLENSKHPNIFPIMTPFNNGIKYLDELSKYFSANNIVSNKTINIEKRKKVTFVFPGQGSQVKGMGEGLFDEFRELVEKADDILGYSIKELCIEDPNNQLGQTNYTQPALYTVNALTYLKKIKEIEQKPDFVAGHSLGEYVALFAAGAFDFETGLKMVKKRGELMGLAAEGGMAAVMGLTYTKVAEVLEANNLNAIDIADQAMSNLIVISGLKADMERAKDIFEDTKGVRIYAPLKISGPFHSHYMEEAKKQFEGFIDTFEFSNLQIPVISSVTARPYNNSDIKKNLVKQITHPARWMETIKYLIGLDEMEFKEIGPGKVLTGLIKSIKKEVKRHRNTQALEDFHP